MLIDTHTGCVASHGGGDCPAVTGPGPEGRHHDNNPVLTWRVIAQDGYSKTPEGKLKYKTHKNGGKKGAGNGGRIIMQVPL